MKEIIHKISIILQWVFVITNFLSIGTEYWYISMLLWGASAIIFWLTSE